jgi:transposase
MDLTMTQWELVKPIIGDPPRRSDNRGRPWQDDRIILNGILWILRTGAPWKDMPGRYPPYQTCHRRFKSWVRRGIFEKILRTLANDLKNRGKLDLAECFIDGSFTGAQKGGSAWEKPSGERAPRSWQLQTALVFLSPYISKTPLLMKQNWLKQPLLKDLSEIDRLCL